MTDKVAMLHRIETLRTFKSVTVKQREARQTALESSARSGGRYVLAHEAIIKLHDETIAAIDRDLAQAIKDHKDAAR